MGFRAWTLFLTALPLAMVACTAHLGSSHARPGSAVEESEQFLAYSAADLSCTEPFALEQDCSNLWGPRRAIRVAGVRLNVAGSRDGTIVLLAGPRPNLDTLVGRHDDVTNAGYHAVKAELGRRGVNVVSLSVVGDGGLLYAYLIKTDGDAYSILKEFSVGLWAAA